MAPGQGARPDETTVGQNVVTARRRPMRSDGRHTQELILEAAAELLEETGFEQLSTGLICKRAGLTPPALYRYYPNKYAVLFEIAHALLTRQHEVLADWVRQGGFTWDALEDGLASMDRLQHALRTVVDEQKGAIWILRAMRSVPLLREVRVAARKVMLKSMVDGMRARCPWLSHEALEIPVRLFGEIIHLETELELDEPQLEAHALRRSVSLAAVSYIAAISIRKTDA